MGVTLDVGVMTRNCLLFRNEVKLQLNIDMTKLLANLPWVFTPLRLCYSPLSGVTSVSKVTPTYLIMWVCMCAVYER